MGGRASRYMWVDTEVRWFILWVYGTVHVVYMYVVLPSVLFLRRAALVKWKEKVGSSATYNKLIGVFERAGYKNYADIVRKVVHVSDSEADDSSGSDDSLKFPLPQPQTYPCLQPRNSPSPTELLSAELSSSESYFLINPAILKSLPEGEI